MAPEVRWSVVFLLLACTFVSPTVAQQQQVHEVALMQAPDLRIGSVHGPPETLFAGVVGAVLLPDGRIAVGDGGSHAIRMFHTSGNHLWSLGREGSGPGEFRALRWVGECPDGSLMAVDGILRRASVLSVEGAVRRTIRLPDWYNFDAHLSCEAGERLVALVDQPRELGKKGEVTRYPARLVSYRLGTDSLATLGVLAGTDYYFSNVTGYSDLPLGARAFAAVGGNRVYFGQSDEGRIRVIDLVSGRQKSFEHELPLREVTAAAWERAKAERIAREPLAGTKLLLERVLAEAPAPKQHPYYTDMKTDRSGRLWLKMDSTPSVSTWRVFGPDGEPVGSVKLRANLDPLDMGESHLLGVERDLHDVEFLVLYRFDRLLEGVPE